MRPFLSGPALGALLVAVSGCNASHPAESPNPTAPTTLVTLVDVQPAIEVTAGGTGTWNWAGQSVTIPPGGTFENIRFNWYLSSQRSGQPTAFGVLYVLTVEYLGLPGGLNPSMPGYVGRSESIEDGLYVFPRDVRLAGGTKYWFYTDTQGAWSGSFDTDIYSDGDGYVSGHHTVPFRRTAASGRMVNGVFVAAPVGVYTDANFKLQGSLR